MPTKTQIVKTAARFVVGAGTSKIVKAIIDNNIDPKNRYERIVTTSGAIVIGAMASDATKEYTDSHIDDIVNAWNDMKAEIAASKNLKNDVTVEGEIITAD